MSNITVPILAGGRAGTGRRLPCPRTSAGPRWSERSTAGEEPDVIQSSELQVGRALRTERWKCAVATPSPTGWCGGSAEKSSDVDVERYLCDLARDPHERVTLVGRPDLDFRTVAGNLRDRLRAHIREIEGKSAEIKPYENEYTAF